jgi:DNA repair protein RadD
MSTYTAEVERTRPIAPVKLRPYQQRAVARVRRALLTAQSVLLVEFMGAGKTVEAAEVVRGYLARGKRVLVLAHRGEILKQTARRFQAVGIPSEEIGFIWGDREQNTAAAVQIASVQTLARRDMPHGIGLVIVDEAHHVQAASWKKILGRCRTAKTLGLTATPERLDGKPLREFFSEMIVGEGAETLIESDYLTRPEIWTREDGWRPKGLPKSGGDYAAKDAADAMSGTTIVGGIPKQYLQRAKGLPAVGFAATKKQARVLIDACRRAGVSSEALFGEHTETEREAILGRLKSGKTKIVWTCDVLGEGWDYPGARCVILARPTASIARYMQWCGRCMRPGERAVVLDHAGNFHEHGFPWEDREWSLDGRAAKTLWTGVVGKGGRVSFAAPIEVDGQLVRADWAEERLLPCCVNGCQNFATKRSSGSARNRGTRPYCEKHKVGTKPLSKCSHVGCKNFATKISSESAPRNGSRPYCEKHRRGPYAPKPLSKCSHVGCKNFATKTSSKSARNRGSRPHCEKHKGGPYAPKPLSKCSHVGCKNFATKTSSRSARYRGRRPYCEKHKGGRQ